MNIEQATKLAANAAKEVFAGVQIDQTAVAQCEGGDWGYCHELAVEAARSGADYVDAIEALEVAFVEAAREAIKEARELEQAAWPMLTCAACKHSEKGELKEHGHGWTVVAGRTLCACCAGEELDLCELCGRIGEHTHDRVPQEWRL